MERCRKRSIGRLIRDGSGAVDGTNVGRLRGEDRQKMQFEEDEDRSVRKEALARALGTTNSTSTASCSSTKLPRRVARCPWSRRRGRRHSRRRHARPCARRDSINSTHGQAMRGQRQAARCVQALALRRGPPKQEGTKGRLTHRDQGGGGGCDGGIAKRRGKMSRLAQLVRGCG